MNNPKNAIDVLKNEIECVERRAGGECNGGTDCQNCDLVLPDFMVLDALRMAVEAVERRTPQKPIKLLPKKPMMQFTCPSCGKGLAGTDCCYHCGQTLNWELEKGS